MTTSIINNMIDCSFNNNKIKKGKIKKGKIKKGKIKKGRKRDNHTQKIYNNVENVVDINNNNSIPATFYVNDSKQVIAIYKSIKQNYIFYITILLCLYVFTKCSHNKSNFIYGIGSMIFITFYGYLIHYLSHFMGNTVSEIYKSYDNIFTRNKYFDWFAKHLIYFGEFHSRVHHDTSINKTYKNIALEIINNFITQGWAIIVIKYGLNLVDNRVILLWALYYATVHNINYNMIHPLTHKQHHMNNKTNYGIDIWDIIIGSKYDWDEVETHNHTSINLILITAVIYYFSNKFKI
jgi:hypothetical protein